MKTRTGQSILRALALLLAAVLLTGFGGPLVERTREGNKRLDEGDYEGALRAYTDAQLEDPENPILQYNIGDVKFRQQKYDEAIESYRQAMRSPDTTIQRDAHYNIGNSLFAQGDLANAILSYKKALEIDPDDADAKYNLEFARRKLKEQQEQQQKQQQQQQQGDSSQQQQGEQQQQQPGEQEDQQGQQKEAAQGQQQPEPEDEKKDQTAAGADPGEQPEAEDPEKDRDQAAGQTGRQPQDGALTEAQAQAILDALEDSEKEAQQELVNQTARSRDRNKDW